MMEETFTERSKTKITSLLLNDIELALSNHDPRRVVEENLTRAPVRTSNDEAHRARLDLPHDPEVIVDHHVLEDDDETTDHPCTLLRNLTGTLSFLSATRTM
jgi:hypothetical protein